MLLTRIVQLFIISVAFITGIGLFFSTMPPVDFTLLEHNYHKNNGSRVVDEHEHLLWTYSYEYHNSAQFDSLPKHLIQAFRAAEDRQFFAHHGISWKGIIRSVLVNVLRGKKAQGASTITQQLVRLLYYGHQKTWIRKIQEQITSLVIEQEYSKEQIFEAYVNTVYLGCGIYGVSTAAWHFWQKELHELTLDECALIAGIVRHPATYCPLIQSESAEKRRNRVLLSMKEAGFITDEEYAAAREKPINLNPSIKKNYGHLRAYVTALVEHYLGVEEEALYTNEYTIHLTVDGTFQESAQRELQKAIASLRSSTKLPLDGAWITLDSHTGAIKALVGGYDFKVSQFNRATQAKRQIGSIHKPFIFAAGLEKGLSFTDILVDEPMTLHVGNQEWSPRNHNRKFIGAMTRAQGLILSNNIVTLKTLLETGYKKLISYYNLMCPEIKIQELPSLATGCIDMTPLQGLKSFNSLINNGIYVEPFIVQSIEDSNGKKIYKHIPHQSVVMSWNIASKVTKILENIFDRTYKRLYKEKPPFMACGKTGTTGTSVSYVGATPGYTSIGYIGCDDNREIPLWASSTVFPLWTTLHAQLKHQASFNYAPHLKEIYVDALTGMPTASTSPYAIKLLS
jgi:penicillin-binding protein 1A